MITKGQGEDKNGGVIVYMYRIWVWDDEKFCGWIVVVAAQQCECIWCHWAVHLKMVKMVNFMLGISGLKIRTLK